MNPENTPDSVRKLNIMLLILSLFMIFNFKNINLIVEKLFRSLGLKEVDQEKKENKDKINWAPFVLLTPVLIMSYYDYASTSWSSLVGVNKIFGGDNLYNYILKRFGMFGLIYTFSKNVGMTRSLNQINVVNNPIVRFFIIWGIAFAFTKNRSEGLIGTILFLFMKLIVSKNIRK